MNSKASRTNGSIEIFVYRFSR